MGYTTDFIGHVNIDPPLNQAEQAYLTAFADSRRCRRAGGPYEVPRNPAAERAERVADLDAHNIVAAGQPSFWCGWHPSWDGSCLAHDGVEKFYGATKWLAYLIDQFLAPDALAARSGLDWFSEFTFDHTLDGIVAACRRDTRRLYLIRVEQNDVYEETVVPSDPRYDEYGPLPYEITRDEQEADRQQTRRRQPKQ